MNVKILNYADIQRYNAMSISAVDFYKIRKEGKGNGKFW